MWEFLNDALGEKPIFGGSEIVAVMLTIEFCTSVNCELKYLWTNVGEPTGAPRRQNPVVSLMCKAMSEQLLVLGVVE